MIQAILNGFSALMSWLSSIIQAVLSWFGSLFGLVWHSFLTLVLSVLVWLGELLAAAVGAVVGLVLLALTWAVGKLPAVPTPPAVVLQLSGFANQFLPLTEMGAALLIVGTIYAAIYAYKLVKLIRGGG